MVKIEQVSDVSEIQHPAIRHALLIEGQETLNYITGDLPARSGLGSARFSVGILNALRTLAEKRQIEHHLLREQYIWNEPF